MSIQALELALVTIFGDGGLIVADCKYHNICKLTATHGDYCILHSPDETKDRLEFKTAFQKHWHESNDFSHFVFTFTFPPKILTDGSHHEKFTLDSAKLDHAVFKGNVKCENISIIDCSFSSAEFEKEAFFKDVKFLGKTTFTSAVFFENAIFRHSSFADETSFYYTLFEKVLYLDNITFMGKSNFANVQIIPDNPNTFITFKEVTFSDYVNFSNAKIFGRIDFSSTRFNKEAIFWKSDFRGLSSFSSCEFHGNLILFDESSFQHKQTTFFRCQFHNGPSFKKTEFGGPVVFENTEFYNGVRFVDTVFKREVTFDETLFKGYSLFEGTEKPIFSNTKVVFKDVILDPPETLNIRNADFKKTTLTQLNLEKASLTAITWPKKGLFISRNCIFDEKINRNPSQVERLYRELKRNFEEKKDWTRAGDFHYSEKEIRYKSAESFGLKFILWLHRTFGAYGERASIPFFWLTILFVVCSMLYTKFGLVSGDSSSLTQASAVDCFRYSLETLFFLKPTDLIPIGFSQYVRTIESILGPVFAALTAWAVRQQLRR